MEKKDKKTDIQLSTKTKVIRYFVYFVLIAFYLVGLCYLIFFMISDVQTNADLKYRGQKVIATVTDKETKYGVKTHRGWSPNTQEIDYYFIYKTNHGKDIREVSQNVDVSETLYNSVEKGSTLEVVYLQQDPKVNQPADELGRVNWFTKVIFILAFGMIFFYTLSRLTRSFEKKHIPRKLFRFMFGIILIAVAFTLSNLISYVLLTLLF